ncbi:MAG: PIN domain-containing protein [Candidatus Cloacimonetes bacterium]|nr:PIN domain-containing protein [Candidatus Cloacimonadota bacterium]MBL7085657.1 PIN domain-containing protein [Candidatus Cloacimonadota bacterium]
MKKTVYLDTTIPSYLFDKRKSLQPYSELTRKWLETEKNNYDIWLSEETLSELEEGDYPNKARIIEFASKIQTLPYDKSIVEIAQVYIDNYVMSQILKGDAIHLAYASYYKMDFLLTWNCNHLANANKRQHIRIINTRLNLFMPEIVTPLVLFAEEKL